MKTVTDFPQAIQILDPVFIEMSDGVRLAARIWLPENAEDHPVPAILEYLPYRRRDGTAQRDALTHPYIAGHGYACVRVDIRGSGDSEGALRGEYLKQEQDDGLEIIDWIANQSWCTGAVGMIGISWGGFNGLQIAARRPPALKAIVSICSTDDRYADDIHFMGGGLLVEKLQWAAAMFSINTKPPDPEMVGDRWRDMWRERLEDSGLWLETWLEHQRRDDFYRHGSVCEDFAAIEAAVFAVGGWADGYTNAVFRLLAGLKSPCKGLIGPWAHKYPHFAKPDPAIGFLQECVRWWDHWLKGLDTGVMDEPQLRCWLQDPAPPRTYYDNRPGRWVAEDCWPSPRTAPRRFFMNRGGLAETAGSAEPLSVSSPQTTGLAAGRWCGYGLVPDQPDDQRAETGGSLVFDTAPLAEDVEVLGPPVAELLVTCDRPNGLVAVVLSEIMPDGAATRISYGILNLTHRNSHETPEPLEPGKPYRVRVQLNDIGHRFAAENRIRIALSSAYWPIVWPSPEKTTLTLQAGASTLDLPVRPARAEDAMLRPFDPPEAAPPLDTAVLREGDFAWTVLQDKTTGLVTMRERTDGGHIAMKLFNDWQIDTTRDDTMTIHPDDPTSARAETLATARFVRGDWTVSSRTNIIMTSTTDRFQVTARLDAYEGDELVHSQCWDKEFKRDLV